MVKLIKTGKKNGMTEVELVPSDSEIKVIKIDPDKKRKKARSMGRAAQSRPKGGWGPGV